METRCVPFKFTIEDKEYEAYILEKHWEEIVKALDKSQKKTGYERSEYNKIYFYENSGIVGSSADWGKEVDSMLYRSGNYYSDKTIAENNARADNLMRQLRRFAAEHRNKEIDWNKESYKYTIRYGHHAQGLFVSYEIKGQDFGCIWFDTADEARLAIKTFHDELIWYFTEYKDSL